MIPEGLPIRGVHGVVALVTGGASGIGRATALGLAASGARVVVSTNLDIAGGELTVKAILDSGGEATFIRADVSDAEQVMALIEGTVATFGRLDCAVNNACATGPARPTADLEDDDWDRITGENLRGAFLCMKHEIRQMLDQGTGGAIVNVAAASDDVNARVNVAESASKHGIVGLTRSAAIDYAPDGIRVNAVCPGGILLPFPDHPHRTEPAPPAAATTTAETDQLGTAAEVAAAILWLCSPAASFVSGIVMPVDGGFLARDQTDSHGRNR